MRYQARFALAGLAMLGLAGCGSTDPESAGPSGSGTSEDIVAVDEINGADVLVDAAGHTLYTAEVEKDGHIYCVGACTSSWSPTLASSTDARAATEHVSVVAGGRFGVVARPGGERQLTFEGRPLYTFSKERAGQLTGDGVTDTFEGTHFVWSAVQTRGPSKPVGMQNRDQQGGGYGY